MSISEHFEMDFELPKAEAARPPAIRDYLYQTSADVTGTSLGLWGLLRSYNHPQPRLPSLSTHARPFWQRGKAQAAFQATAQAAAVPVGATRTYSVTAVSVADALLSNDSLGTLVYNSRGAQAVDPNALVYVRTEDLIVLRRECSSSADRRRGSVVASRPPRSNGQRGCGELGRRQRWR
jgi:hypothetical protein